MTTHSTKLVKFLRCLVILKLWNFQKYITPTVTSQRVRLNIFARVAYISARFVTELYAY